MPVAGAIGASAAEGPAQRTPSIDWWVIGNGGGPASGGVALECKLGEPTIGIADAGFVGLEAGYWSGIIAPYQIKLRIIMRSG